MKKLYKILLTLVFALNLSESQANTLLNSLNSAYLNNSKLNAERANMRASKEEKREAKESTDDYRKNNSVLFEEYLQIKKGETELLKTIPPNLKPYYKNKVNEYFKSIEKEYD